MFAGNGEVAAPVVCLEASLAVTTGRQLSSYEDMNAGPGWAYLRVGVELSDDRPSPRLYLPGLWVEATIQVYAAEVVLRSEHEAYPTVAVFLTGSHGLLVASPGLRDRTTCSLSRKRRVGDLRRLAIALLRT